jgi:hypothetical protein
MMEPQKISDGGKQSGLDGKDSPYALHWNGKILDK